MNEDRQKVFEQIKAIDGAKEIGSIVYKDISLPMMVVEKNLNHVKSKILVLSSEHGDEPAGVYSNLNYLDEFDENRFSEIGIVSFPLVDPHGFINNSHKNPEGYEIYSTFGDRPSTQEAKLIANYVENKKFDLAISLHEDSEIGESYSNGFYVIECPKATGLGRAVIENVSQNYKRTDARRLWGERGHDGGVVVWKPDKKSTDLFPTLLNRKQVKYCLFTETCVFSDSSGKQENNLQDRISNQYALLNAAISYVIKS